MMPPSIFKISPTTLAIYNLIAFSKSPPTKGSDEDNKQLSPRHGCPTKQLVTL